DFGVAEVLSDDGQLQGARGAGRYVSVEREARGEGLGGAGVSVRVLRSFLGGGAAALLASDRRAAGEPRGGCVVARCRRAGHDLQHHARGAGGADVADAARAGIGALQRIFAGARGWCLSRQPRRAPEYAGLHPLALGVRGTAALRRGGLERGHRAALVGPRKSDCGGRRVLAVGTAQLDHGYRRLPAGVALSQPGCEGPRGVARAQYALVRVRRLLPGIPLARTDAASRDLQPGAGGLRGLRRAGLLRQAALPP